MKVLFVKPGSADTGYPHAYAALMSYARTQGHAVRFLDCSLTRESPQFAALVAGRTGADFIALSVLTGWHGWVRAFIQALPPGTRTIVGGPHVSALGEDAMEHLGADYGVIGEGEEGLARILRDPFCVPKLSTAPRIRDLRILPTPAYDLIPPSRYFHTFQGASVSRRHREICQTVTSRGCPYHCTFCATNATWGGKIRFFSPERVQAEVEELVYRRGVREIWFGDDGFTARPARAIEICERIAPLHIPWRIPNGVRLDTLTEPLVRAMARAGCYMTGIGIETGSPEMMIRIKKRLDLSLVHDKVALLGRYGITASGFFIIGFPGETRETMRATTEFMLRSNLPRAQICTFRPVPGSESWDEIFKTDEQVQEYLYFGKTPTIPRSVTEEEVATAYWQTLARFYARPRILADLALDVRWAQVKDIWNRFIRRKT